MKRRAAIAVGLHLITLSGCVATESSGGNRLNEEGDIRIFIDGSKFDLSKKKFQAESAQSDLMAFHLHEGDNKWYMEGKERVTFAEAINKIPHFSYKQEGDNDSMTVDDDRYSEENPGTEISYIANENEVEPTTYKLQDGDNLVVEITTG
ncbi:hypothetical protein [Haladaptatus cibarius]|uniref:hypothetical protein n=1 Tax=Haladaptatus cibarius TaxID=453847 RepID=UPI0006792B87|nr:hypothetical protein [Haladaptatus cibarius]